MGKKKSTKTLGGRMKRYEASGNMALYRRIPVILRIDGVKFSKFTKGFVKPFDKLLMKTMQQTMESLCREIQGSTLGYTQSDEISLLLVDYQTLESDAWYDNDLSKLCSVGASTATMFFTEHFFTNVRELGADMSVMTPTAFYDKYGVNKVEVPLQTYERKLFKARFDCRAFNVPKEDVANYFLWRQQDAERNSVQMLGQSLYSHKSLQGISNKALQNKMFTEKGVNWSELPTPCKRGSVCKKGVLGTWTLDLDMPRISLDREYIQEKVEVEV